LICSRNAADDLDGLGGVLPSESPGDTTDRATAFLRPETALFGFGVTVAAGVDADGFELGARDKLVSAGRGFTGLAAMVCRPEVDDANDEDTDALLDEADAAAGFDGVALANDALFIEALRALVRF
jgi:hypothetical protein